MKKRATAKIVVGIIVLCVIILSASYAYFSNARTSMDLTIGNANITYTINASSSLSLTANPYAPLNSTVIAQNSVSTDTVYLQNGGSNNITCEYEIWYTPTTTFNNSSGNTNNLTELAILGSESSNQNSAFSFDLNGVSSATKIYEGTISAGSSASLTQTWTFTLVHYNLDVNQSNNVGKSIAGKISFVANGCKKGKTAYQIVTGLANSSNTDSQNRPWTVKSENGLRYEGKDPNNYICFKDNCTSSDLYRIIGVIDDTASSGNTTYTNKLLKIVKNNSYTNSTYGSTNSWNNSATKTTLNGTYLSTASVSDISSMILTAKWNLLVPSSYTGGGSTWYTGERSGSKYSSNPASVNAKVGLIYPSDYIYASYVTGNCTRTSSYSTNCNNYNWLFNTLNTWTISPDKNNTNKAILINTSGSPAATTVSTSSAIIPAFYLRSNVVLYGTGTTSDPYRFSETYGSGGQAGSGNSVTITSATFYTDIEIDGNSCITDVTFNENVSVANYYININNNGYNEISISNNNCYSNSLPTIYSCYNKTYNYDLYAVLANGETTAVYSSSYTPTCFKGETKVLTVNGYVNIKDVKIGDEVYSYNEETKQVELNKITKLYVHNDNHIYIIKVGNETIEVTKDHRIYVKDKYGKDYQWKRVDDIMQGDYLYTIGGREIPIYSITYKNENNKVYNIEVDNNHTYYVTKSNYLVHNAKVPQGMECSDIPLVIV